MQIDPMTQPMGFTEEGIEDLWTSRRYMDWQPGPAAACFEFYRSERLTRRAAQDRIKELEKKLELMTMMRDVSIEQLNQYIDKTMAAERRVFELRKVAESLLEAAKLGLDKDEKRVMGEIDE